jgi:hypothetical protein
VEVADDGRGSKRPWHGRGPLLDARAGGRAWRMVHGGGPGLRGHPRPGVPALRTRLRTADDPTKRQAQED